MVFDQQDRVGVGQSMMASRGSDDVAETDHGSIEEVVVEVLGEMGV